MKNMSTKTYEQTTRVCISSSLKVNSSKTKIIIFGCNVRKLNQEALHLDKDPIEIIHE